VLGRPFCHDRRRFPQDPDMMAEFLALRRLLGVGVLCLLAVIPAAAEEVRVVSSGGFAPALKSLAAPFEKATGHHLVLQWGPSMGETPNAIPNRLQRGEPIDVVIMVGSALDRLVEQGKVVPGSRKLLARSRIGLAVKAGAPRPDISTVQALKEALLQARSIAYSDSASGVFLTRVLFPRLGIAEQLKDKARMIPADPVGESVARGEFELGFQQISELKAVAGIDLVGPLPAEANDVTLYTAALVKGAMSAQAGQALIAFLASPSATAAINGTGLEAAGGQP
jgi:molybdate transport system substrate-binding protein